MKQSDKGVKEAIYSRDSQYGVEQDNLPPLGYESYEKESQRDLQCGRREDVENLAQLNVHQDLSNRLNRQTFAERPLAVDYQYESAIAGE